MDTPRHKKLLLDRFQEHLGQKFRDYCTRHPLDETDDKRLLTFLIDQELIPPVHIQRYAVLREFEQVYQEAQGHKTQAVQALADRFCISERTVWSILKGEGQRRRK